MRPLTEAEVKERGITTKHDEMPNGEQRFRLLSSDGSGYIRSEAGQTSNWQKSHFHKQLLETYIIQTGWIILAQYINRRTILTKYTAGQSFVVQPGVIHNIYVSAKSVHHVVKFGGTTSNDWQTSPEFDALTKALGEPDFKTLTKKSD